MHDHPSVIGLSTPDQPISDRNIQVSRARFPESVIFLSIADIDVIRQHPEEFTEPDGPYIAFNQDASPHFVDWHTPANQRWKSFKDWSMAAGFALTHNLLIFNSRTSSMTHPRLGKRPGRKGLYLAPVTIVVQNQKVLGYDVMRRMFSMNMYERGDRTLLAGAKAASVESP